MRFLFPAFLLLPLCGLAAEPDDKIKVEPVGRILVDGAAYLSDDSEVFKPGVAIPEVRIGVKGAYQQFSARAEMSYAYGKVSLRDVFIKVDLDDRSSIKIGNFIHYFGLSSAYNASMKSTMIAPLSNSAFDIGRSIGVMYTYCGAKWLTTTSVTAESKASVFHVNELRRSAWGAVGRCVYRPVVSGSGMMQFGISAALMGAPYNADAELNHKSFAVFANYPTDVVAERAVGTVIAHANSVFKASPELLLAKDKVAFETQYYFNRFFRRGGLRGVTNYGAYGLIRGMIHGSGYGYDASLGCLSTPKPGTLELVGCYNYTSLDDSAAGIKGGRVSDVSCTFNWYINRYVIWRIRGGYTHAFGDAPGAATNLATIQTRLQILF